MADGQEVHRSLLDPRTLRQLLERLSATDVDELEIADGSSRLYVRRQPGRRIVVDQQPQKSPQTAPAGVPIVAPLTGVYYSRPAPDQEPFAVPGMILEVGQVVALIETMKLFNEVLTEIAGEVLSVVVKDSDLVEVGQPLMYVGPREERDQP